MRGERGARGVLAVCALIVLSAAGFRNDTGVYTGVTAPSLATPRWTVPLSSWSNSSPVVVGDLVCVNVEPATLSCFDKQTGQARWSATHDVVDALPSAEHARLAPRLAEVEKLASEMPSLMSEQSRLRRALRTSTDPALVAQLAQISDRILAVGELQGVYAPYLMPANRQEAGWSMPTPWTDGHAIFVAYGNGVLARHEANGSKTWSTWLGAAPDGFRGWRVDGGPTSTASPRLVDGTLLSFHGAVRGVDPATGAVRWTGPEYRDFGTPSVARVDGQAFAITPDGTAIRVRDGRVVAKDLGDVYYVGPAADGDRVVYVGGHDAGDVAESGVTARGLRLTSSGDTLKATVLWERTLPVRQRVFAQPLLADGAVWLVQEYGQVTVLDAATGLTTATLALPARAEVGYYSSPVLAGGSVWVGHKSGTIARLQRSTSGALTVSDANVAPLRSTPTFERASMWVRTLDDLRSYGP